MMKKQRKNEKCKLKHIADKVMFDLYSKIDLKGPGNFDSSLKNLHNFRFCHFQQAIYFIRGAGLTSVGSNIHL